MTEGSQENKLYLQKLYFVFFLHQLASSKHQTQPRLRNTEISNNKSVFTSSHSSRTIRRIFRIIFHYQNILSKSCLETQRRTAPQKQQVFFLLTSHRLRLIAGFISNTRKQNPAGFCRTSGEGLQSSLGSGSTQRLFMFLFVLKNSQTFYIQVKKQNPHQHPPSPWDRTIGVLQEPHISSSRPFSLLHLLNSLSGRSTGLVSEDKMSLTVQSDVFKDIQFSVKAAPSSSSSSSSNSTTRHLLRDDPTERSKRVTGRSKSIPNKQINKFRISKSIYPL